MNEVVKNASSSSKAGSSPGLYPAERLAAEAERLEREHDAIEQAKRRLFARMDMLSSGHVALKTEMVSHVREAQQLGSRIEALEERGHREIEAAWADIKARRVALVDVRVNLALSRKAHNSDPRHQINMIADRVSRLLEEADAIKEDVKDIYAEAKGAGFDAAALRAAVAVKRVDLRRSRRGASG
jgi:uncharacterized protein (UPF0335 family)